MIMRKGLDIVASTYHGSGGGNLSIRALREENGRADGCRCK